MANVNRYSSPVIPAYPFNEEKMLAHNETEYANSNHGNKNNDNTDRAYLSNGSLEEGVVGTANLDTIVDSLPLFRQRPVKTRNSGVDRRERSRKCLSVGAFECPPTVNPRISMYELGDYGWVSQEGVDRKNVLNLDAEINDIIQTNTVAEVNLGHIKIMF